MSGPNSSRAPEILQQRGFHTLCISGHRFRGTVELCAFFGDKRVEDYVEQILDEQWGKLLRTEKVCHSLVPVAARQVMSADIMAGIGYAPVIIRPGNGPA